MKTRPLVIFCYYQATAKSIAATFGLKVFTQHRDMILMLDEINAGRSVVVIAQAYATGWRAECDPVILAEVPEGPLRVQAAARGDTIPPGGFVPDRFGPTNPDTLRALRERKPR